MKIVTKLASKCISLKLEKIKPIEKCEGKFFYFDYETSNTENTPKYPYIVTSENLELVKSNWYSTRHRCCTSNNYSYDTKLGDVIDEITTGNHLQLCGRTYEIVLRDGVEVARRLLRMS